MRRRSICLLSGSTALVLSSLYAAGSDQLPLLGLNSLTDVHIVSQPISSNLTALPLNSPPINGFTPQVIFTLTDEQQDDLTFESKLSSTPGGNTLPVGAGAPSYFIATYDTGSQSHLISYDTLQQVNLDSAERTGDSQSEIVGASGTETVDVSDPLGIYATGFSHGSVDNSGVLTAGAGSVKGETNTSILSAEQGSTLPNIVGAPMTAMYQTVIRNTQTNHITVGGTTYRSPEVSFQAVNTTLPSSYFKLTLSGVPSGGFTTPPSFFPSIENPDNFDDNPAEPTFWASLEAGVSGMGANGGSFNSASTKFLFDSGAQVSVVSEDTAASVGFFSGGPNPSKPDFFVEVEGVGGATSEVPGFYMQSLSILTNGGTITWNHVPVVVLDLPDPSGNGSLPGVLGMNLFTDRDLIINGGSNPYVGFSQQWMWGKSSGGGSWSSAANWTLGVVPNAEDAQANFFNFDSQGSISNAQSITVDTSVTVGVLGFDNSKSFTINGPGVINMQASLNDASINVNSGTHTINAAMNFLSDTTLSVIPQNSSLTITGNVSSAGVNVIKDGLGTLTTNNVRALSLTVLAGTVKIASNNTANSSAGTSVVTALSVSSGAILDLTNNSMVIDYTAPLGTQLTDVRKELQSGQITSSMADATHRIGFGDNAVLGKTSFAGQMVDSSSILFKFTYAGDSNLDGEVDVTDLGALASHWQAAGNWTDGDFNYDGSIDVTDLGILATDWQAGVGNPLGMSSFQQALAEVGLSGVFVPEPAAIAMIGLLLAAAAPRRRRATSQTSA